MDSKKLFYFGPILLDKTIVLNCLRFDEHINWINVIKDYKQCGIVSLSKALDNSIKLILLTKPSLYATFYQK